MGNIGQINKLLQPYHVEVHFSKESLDDLSSYDKNQQEKIIALIFKRAMTGPLIKPQGIKPKNMALRIVYRPIVKDEIIRMEIIAIGPRDKKKVYRLAAKQLLSLNDQIE